MDMNEISGLIEEMGDASLKFREHYKKRFDDLEKYTESLEAKMNRMGMTGGLSVGGFDKAALANESKAIAAFVRSGGIDVSELKAHSIGSDPDGGYWVLPQVSGSITKRLFDLSPVRRLARVENIVKGDAFEELLDLNDVGATRVGEKSARPATTTAQLGKLRIPLHEIYALQPVTQRLLDDSGYDIGGWINGKISDKFGRTEGSEYVSGDGVLGARGFLTYTTATTADGTRAENQLQHVVSGDANGFVAPVAATGVSPADCLINLCYKLRAPYKTGGNVAWLMNSSTAAIVSKFKNAQADFIWRDGVSAGQPPSLLGFPVELDENMPDVAAGTYPIAFGNWTLGYCVIERPGLKLLLDPYTDKPNVLFYAYRRSSGDVANFDAIKLLKIST